MLNYEVIVATYLENCTPDVINEIAHHGIHNITNDFSNTDYDYEKIAREFVQQVQTIVREQEHAR